MQHPIIDEVLGLIQKLNGELASIEADVTAGRISSEKHESCKRAFIQAGNELCAIFDIVSYEHDLA